MFSHLPFLQYEGSWHSFTSAKGTTDTGYSRNMWSGTALTAGGGHNNSATSQHAAPPPNYQVGFSDCAL